MRIAIDPQLCEGNAVCEALAPMVFELDPGQQARLIAEVSGPGGERLLRGAVPIEEVERAVEAVR